MRRALVVLGGVAALCGWAVLMYAVSVRLVAVNADDANTLLAGWDMVHGNVLLHGWSMPRDSFLTGDIPISGILAAAVGVGPRLVHVVPVVLAAGCILAALWYASSGAKNRWLAMLPVVLLVGLPTPLQSIFWLQSPMHVATILYCLVAFGCLARAGRWWWSLATAALTAAVIGDSTALAIGIVPVALASVASIRGQRRAESWRRLAAGGVATVVAVALTTIFTSVGGVHTGSNPPLAPASSWGRNLLAGLGRLLDVTGSAAGPPLSHDGPLAHWVHLVGLAGLTCGIGAGAIALVRSRRAEDESAAWLSGVLALGSLAGLGLFVVLSRPGGPVPESRYLLPTVVMGSVACGRWLGSIETSGRWRSVLAFSAAAVVVLYAVTPLQVLTRHWPEPATFQLAAWLEARGLHSGAGGYWDASSITVASRGEVVVRPVVAVGGRLHGYPYFADQKWFSAPGADRPRFLVYERSAPWGDVDLGSASATLGQPAAVDEVGPYVVLVWSTAATGRVLPPVG